ncbi:MAG: hypothetical protein ACTHJT_03845 [Cytophaga sp.]|uniref:hypothetical protein n=1 Tax=Cytophaga sp. TaxID=29535 RepID=UPI003F7DF55F
MNLEQARELIAASDLPAEIKDECTIVFDLLDVSSDKPQLKNVALLVSAMTLEKAFRIVLYAEYKTITKIKFSILIDKAQQLEYISKATADQLRQLKNNRNAHAHQRLLVTDDEQELISIPAIMECVYSIFTIYYQRFPEQKQNEQHVAE